MRLVLLEAPGRPVMGVELPDDDVAARARRAHRDRVGAVRVDVLNGVNLDVLGRRDPELYGGLSLDELETRIYEWATRARLHVRCRQTNHEGQYVDWCHDALDWPTASIVNPGAWTHYS